MINQPYILEDDMYRKVKTRPRAWTRQGGSQPNRRFQICPPSRGSTDERKREAGIKGDGGDQNILAAVHSSGDDRHWLVVVLSLGTQSQCPAYGTAALPSVREARQSW